MRPKSLLLLALALSCGLIASIGISQVLDSNKQKGAVETAPIYVALQNINLGDPIDDAMVSLEEWPKDKIPAGAISKWEDIEDRRPRTIIFEGEPLLDGKLLGKGQMQDPIRGIPSGMRLKTISVDARKSVAGLLSPGDRVDLQLFVKRNEPENILHAFTKIILQNIRVYAVDQTIQRSADGTESRTVAKTVSLVVTPQQANRITTAENLGDISLIPRHPDDDKIVDDSEQSADDLLSRSDANSRQREQGVEHKPVGNNFGGIAGMLQSQLKANEPAAEPFRMKIIYPNEVEEVRFSGKTGEPLDNDSENKYGTAGAVGKDPPSSNADSDADSDTDANFPINLQAK